ncbi:MAG: bifunctional glutamate N-acetyltransferase/amino-acid acetyltransferase ArgJ [Phycisphaerae bacterium]
MKDQRHITLPAGFLAAGVRCGIKSRGEDLAVIAADRPAACAVLTTRNQVVGAPVQWCRSVLPRGRGRMRGIVINAGCANVCTGKAGLRDAGTMAKLTASRLGATSEQVLVASTGIIGHRLEMDKIRRGIDAAGDALGTDNDAKVAQAIMTTDTRPKSAVARGKIGGREFTVAGVAKGSGMIAPNMATMIAVITTDAAVTPAALHRALGEAADMSFNAVTVDSDTSTSDTVAAFASGAAGNKPLTAKSTGYKTFTRTLRQVCVDLAEQIAADGEGATKLIRIRVHGATGKADARTAAFAIADSPLVKCAVHGGDPNWGRIAAAAGKSSARVDSEKMSIRIGGVTVFSRGRGRKFDMKAVEKHLAGNKVEIECNLNLGSGEFTALTCDLSAEYVRINADYHT